MVIFKRKLKKVNYQSILSKGKGKESEHLREKPKAREAAKKRKKPRA